MSIKKVNDVQFGLMLLKKKDNTGLVPVLRNFVDSINNGGPPNSEAQEFILRCLSEIADSIHKGQKPDFADIFQLSYKQGRPKSSKKHKIEMYESIIQGTLSKSDSTVRDLKKKFKCLPDKKTDI